MEQEQTNRQLIEAPISKLLLKFSIPCVTSLLIGALYNIVDQIFIGNSSLGYLGNAATGVPFPILCIVHAFAWCVGDGAASYLSIWAGRKDNQKAHKCVGTGITVTGIISLVLMVICLLFCEPLMRLFGASNQTVTLAVDYFTIIVCFFPLYLQINVMNSIIRADGSPAYAMIAMLAGALTNIALDPLFIFVLDWGIKGAAWATVFGQTLSFLISVAYFRKPKNFRLTRSSFLPSWKVLKAMLPLGTSSFVTQIAIAIVTLTCNVMLAQYGRLSVYGQDVAISVFSIQGKVYTVVINIIVGIVLGGQPIFGYNYGAGRMDRVKEAYRKVLLATLAVGTMATAIFQFWPQAVIGLFGSGDARYQEFAVKTFRIYLSLTTVTCIVKMTAIFFQSIGCSIRAVSASLIRDIVCFTPLAVLLPYYLERRNPGTGIDGILYAAPLADFVSLLVVLWLTISFFRRGKRDAK